MLQRLLLLLPETGPAWAWYWWVALVGGGMLLWLAGARVSRPLVTLLLVTAGALAGKHVPPAMGWAVDPMAAIAGTALVAGIAGFALHRCAVGLGLGAVAGLWAVLGCWAAAAGPSYWQWPRRLSELAELKSRLDPQLWQMMLALGGLAAVTGVAVSVLFPRVATTLFWTLTGCSIWCGGAVAWAFYSGPDRLARLPQGDLAQGLLLAAIVLAGFVAQWWQGPGPLKESKAAGGGGVPAAA
ncbi:MAG: hypothetical protein ACK4PI_04855 [Tepidisphaerales bacterium]